LTRFIGFYKKALSLQMRKNERISFDTKINQNEQNMQQKVETYIQKHQLLLHEKPVIVGVSGGTDSVVLLHLLISLGYNCLLAHCNFHLRGEESNRDEQFVRELAKTNKLQSCFINFDTSKFASKKGISIEMAARELRYTWFEQLMEEHDAQAIAVAHHADDNIETLLMNLVRGTGIKGLTGMQPRNNDLVRPLLCLTREEIEQYLIKHDLEHVEDASNSDSEYKRNKFRNEVLPLLEEINPSVRQTLYNTQNNLNGNYEIYQQAIQRIENEITEIDSGILKINIEKLKKQVQIPTVLFEILQPYGFGSAEVNQIVEQLEGESGKIFYSYDYRLVKDRKYLLVEKIETISKRVYFIEESNSQVIEPFKMIISKKTIQTGFQVSKSPIRIQVDASKLKFPLELRHWTEGDSFYPFGMQNRKKVSDYFIDNKFNLPEKERTWLLVSENEIVWIIGNRLDNRFRITDTTTEIVEFELIPKTEQIKS
jgi:tRNA(Ile)-lysidine synthase